ncbi:glutamate-cysteine ligase family protein [Nocardia sp. NPDC127579]|uniref:glutamate-cysteine ligase family protein n=1 Tax=Nocardia sp. NPDC127579 TaxID=3345402 RepID=UPI003631A60D
MAVTLAQSTAPGRATTSGELSSRAAAEAYVGGVCFKLGPPALIGAELEWLTVQGECSAAGPAAAPRPQLAAIAAALGPYAPRSIAPDSPAHPLPGGSRVTIEPGGQIELSSAPYATAAQLCERLGGDARHLRELLGSRAIRTVAGAADADRRAKRMLRLPRYHAMEQSFGGIGPFGKLMMCNTAATQVSVDAGADRAEVAARWTMTYTVGPALLAAFACSPALRGVPVGAWASQRMRTWLRLDTARTRPPAETWSDPIESYSRWALDVPLLCVRQPERMGAADARGRNGAAEPRRGADRSGSRDCAGGFDSADVAGTRHSGGDSDSANSAEARHGGDASDSANSAEVRSRAGGFGIDSADGAHFRNGAGGPRSGSADGGGGGEAGVSWAAPPGATFADWLSGALDDEIGRRPEPADLDYHLTTLFPPVRAAGHLEIRYLDAQPEHCWTTPILAVEALMSSPAVVAEATALAAPTAGRWLEAARHGLADPDIRTAAVDLLALAAAHAETRAAATALDDAARRCRRGQAPRPDPRSDTPRAEPQSTPTTSRGGRP